MIGNNISFTFVLIILSSSLFVVNKKGVKPLKNQHELNNQDMRYLLKLNKITFWKLAEVIGISEPTITRWMRVPLTKERFDRIINAIDQIKKERGDVNE